jgi:hypothetical protein
MRSKAASRSLAESGSLRLESLRADGSKLRRLRQWFEFLTKESYSVIADEVVPNRTVGLPAAWSDEWAQAHFFFGARFAIAGRGKGEGLASQDDAKR